MKAVFAPTHWTNPEGNCPGDSTCTLSSFKDLDPAGDYHDALHFVMEKGLLLGCGDGIFLPEAQVTRAMLAEVLAAYFAG